VAVLSERLTGVAYQLGWKVICRVPQSWARRIFAAVAGIAWRRQGPGVQVLEANLRRVLSWKHGTDEVDGKELRTLSRAALQSYARYWLEVFRLSVTPTERLVSGMRFQGPNEATLLASLKAGRGVIIALPHMGNFEQAGVWVIAEGAGTFTTVAERLRISAVAALAVHTGAALMPTATWFDGEDWGARIYDEIPVPETGTRAEKVAAMSQAMADRFTEAIAEHPQDWHMLQKVFTADLDPARLPRPSVPVPRNES